MINCNSHPMFMVLVLKKSKVLVLTKTVLMVLVLKNLQGLGLVGDGLNYITDMD